MVRPGFLVLALVLALVVSLPGCASGGSGTPAAAPERSLQPSSEQLAVERWNPVWGHAEAPVTVVAFLDFECPYCVKGYATLAALRDEYGPSRLRVVFKHAPLPFHQRALPAAHAAQAVFMAAGSDAFFAYERLLFEHAPALADSDLERWATDVGVDVEDYRKHLRKPDTEGAVTADLELAARIGVTGVPAFFINGAPIVGARPRAEFRAAIEHELVAANALYERGTAPGDVYAARVRVNFAPNADASGEGAESTPYVVAIGDSPSKGAGAEAWVTIVEFADFECPFCQRAHATIKQLMSKYPGKIRWVMKHNPLGFHPLAVPAAVLALELRAQRGDQAYWALLDEWFAEPRLSQAALDAAAQRWSLDPERLARAQALGAAHPGLVADRDLAMDLLASGTPHFFVNGRRIAGAQPYEVFEAEIDAELKHVSQLLASASDAANVYALLQAKALPPPGLERLEIGAPPSSSPRLGDESAPVVIQMFSDFACGYCQRVMPTLAALQDEYPKQIAIVWRHLPLEFHPHARRAAIAALQVHAQDGDDAFWAMANKLFGLEGQAEGPLTAQVIAGHAQSFGVAPDAIEAAVEQRTYDGVIDQDVQLAARLGISGTPTFVINGYRLVGAQPKERFDRLVRLALADHAALPARQAAAPSGRPSGAPQ